MDAIESTVNCSVITAKPRFRFTKENSRLYAVKAKEARAQYKLDREAGKVEKPLMPEERYRRLNVSRVQLQLERHWKELRLEENPAKRKPLIEAIERLANLQKTFSAPGLPDDPKSSRKSSSRPAAPTAR